MTNIQLLNRFVQLHIDKLKEQLLQDRDVLEGMSENGQIDPIELLEMTASSKLITDYRQSLEYAKQKLMKLYQLHFYKHEDASIQWFDKVKMPSRATDNSAGMDFYAPYGVIVPAKGTEVIDTGIGCILPPTTMLTVYARSGMAFNKNVALVNGVGVIDGDYTGSIKVKLINHGDEDVHIQCGDRIAQGVLQSVYIVNPNIIDMGEADEIRSKRYADAKVKRNGGFGSTGQ